ncbi:MAG: DUF975 family protein [Eubacterium sp.]|nr:DUF975 family protein [Eubacterium sp.]
MTRYSRSELKRLARAALLGNYTVLILAMLTASAIVPMLLLPFSIGLTAELNFSMVTYLIAAVIVKVLGRLLSVGVMRMHLLLAQEQQISYMDLFWAVRNQPDRFIAVTFLFVAVLCILAVPAIAVILCLPESAAGYLLLAVVLVLLAAIALFLLYVFEVFYLYYMEHTQATVAQGLRAALALMRGHTKRLFVLQLSFVGWQMLGVCSMGIGMLWIQPYINQTIVNFYLDLTGSLEKKGMHVDASVEGEFPLG